MIEPAASGGVLVFNTVYDHARDRALITRPMVSTRIEEYLVNVQNDD